MTNYYYKADEVRDAAHGSWLAILDALAPQLSPAIDKLGKHVGCPVHGGKDGFRFFKNAHETGGAVCNTCGPFPDGFDLLNWANGWAFTDALKEVGDFVGAKQHQKRSSVDSNGHHDHSKPSNKPTAQENQNPKDVEGEEARMQRKAHLDGIAKKQTQRLKQQEEQAKTLVLKQQKIWDSALAVTDARAKPAQLYFRHRKIFTSKLSNDAIRFSPDFAFHDEDGKFVGKFPTILMAIRSTDGEMQSIHRIYLTLEGSKANVDNAKKMMPVPFGRDVCGASVPLFPLDGSGVLSFAEGSETAQAVYRGFGYPCWSTINTTLMEAIEVPQGVHTVLIWADKDLSLSGEKSALALKVKLQKQGIKCAVFVPPMPIPNGNKGVDWNDVLMTQGMLGFPRRELFDRAQSRQAAA